MEKLPISVFNFHVLTFFWRKIMTFVTCRGSFVKITIFFLMLYAFIGRQETRCCSCWRKYTVTWEYALIISYHKPFCLSTSQTGKDQAILRGIPPPLAPHHYLSNKMYLLVLRQRLVSSGNKASFGISNLSIHSAEYCTFVKRTDFRKFETELFMWLRINHLFICLVKNIIMYVRVFSKI